MKKNTIEIKKAFEALKSLGANVEIVADGIKINGDWNSKYNPHHQYVVEITGTLYTSNAVQDKGFLTSLTTLGSLYTSYAVQDKGFLTSLTTLGSLYTYNAVQDKGFLTSLTTLGSLYTSYAVQDKGFLTSLTTLGSLETYHAVQDKGFLKGVSNDFGDKFVFADNILSAVISKKSVKDVHKQAQDITLYKTVRVGYTDIEYIAQQGSFTAHGESPKKAIEDLRFKIVAEKLKKEPIKPDTEFTVKYYRLLTGACDSGCRRWMQEQGIPFKVVGNDTVELKPIKAKDLLPLLEKTNAYGVAKFKSLMDF